MACVVICFELQFFHVRIEISAQKTHKNGRGSHCIYEKSYTTRPTDSHPSRHVSLPAKSRQLTANMRWYTVNVVTEMENAGMTVSVESVSPSAL